MIVSPLPPSLLRSSLYTVAYFSMLLAASSLSLLLFTAEARAQTYGPGPSGGNLATAIGTLPASKGGTGATSLSANALLVGNGTSPVSPDSNTSTLTAGILGVLGVNGSSSGTFRISTNNVADLMLFKFGGQGGSNTLNLSSTQVLPQKTLFLAYPTAVIPTRAWAATTDSVQYLNTSLTGTVTGTPDVQPILWQSTINVAGANTSALLRMTLSDGTAATTNYYTIDTTVQCGSIPVSGEKECHAFRATSSVNNQGGTIGAPLGSSVGGKLASLIPLGGGNNYMRLGVAGEIVSTNLDPTTQDHIGTSIVAGTGNLATTRRSNAVSFNTTLGGAGRWYESLFDLNGPGAAPTLDSGGTIFISSRAMTVTGVFDLSNITATGNMYNDGKVSWSGVTGNIATIGAVTPSKGVISIGTKFTISGCSADTTLGGAAVGSFISRTTGVCTVVITIAGATGSAAGNGWSCYVNNLTTANLMRQTAYSTTTATVSGTTVTGDLVTFGCQGF